MRVGYLRVSSTDQNTVRQLDGIEVERIFEDKGVVNVAAAGNSDNDLDDLTTDSGSPNDIV